MPTYRVTAEDVFPMEFPIQFGEHAIATDIASIRIKKEFWSPGEFELAIPNTSSNRNEFIGTSGTKGGGHGIKIYRKTRDRIEQLVMKGYVTRMRIGESLITLKGYGSAILLSRYLTGDDLSYSDQSLSTIIDGILSGTGIVRGETSANPPNFSVRYNSENKYKAAFDVVKNLAGWEAYVNTTDSFILKSQVGTDRSASVTFQYGDNIIRGSDRDVDFEQMTSELRIRGEGEGFNQYKYSATSDPVANEFWSTQRVYDDRSIDGIAPASNVAYNRLSMTNAPCDEIQLDIIDKHTPDISNLDIGDTVTVHWPKVGIASQGMRIWSIEYQYNASGETISLNLVKSAGPKNVAAPLDTIIANVSGQAETQARHPQGATNVFQLNSYDNCDSNYPLLLPFYVSDELLRINKAQLNVIPKSFRIFQKETSKKGRGDLGSGGGIPIGPIFKYSHTGWPEKYDDICTMSYTTAYTDQVGVIDIDLWIKDSNRDSHTDVGYSERGSIFDPWLVEIHNSTCNTDWGSINIPVFVKSVTNFPSQHRRIFVNDISDAYPNPARLVPRVQQSGKRLVATSVWMFSMGIESYHSHTIDAGVYEQPSATNLTWTAYIAEHGQAWNKVWSGTSSYANIDFKDYIVSGAWNDIKIAVNSECRMETQAYIEGWVQSRG